MNDFKKSLLAGVDAAKVAVKNKEEIHEVIAEVDKQLTEVYEGKVHFNSWQLQRKVKKKGAITNPFVDALNFNMENYNALAISNSERQEPTPIADWHISENGYPCKISFSDRDAYCYSKEDLIAELSNLLSDVTTGKAILEKLKEHERKQEQP